MGKILVQHGAMEGCNGTEWQPGEFLHNDLYIGPVFPDYVAVVAPRFIIPCFGCRRHGERAEGIGREKHSIGFIKRHHHFRPMHHWGGEEPQGCVSQRKRVSVAHGYGAPRQVHPFEVISQHGYRLGCGHYRQRRIAFECGTYAP